MMNDPTFVYEYVQFAVSRKLDTGGYCIIHQGWKKAQKGTAFDPCIEPTEMKRKMQNNEVRARKEMGTIELRKMLEEEKLPLQFIFPDGSDVIVLPKLDELPNEVYIKWDISANRYVEQRYISFETELHKNWFNKERANSLPGKDWRYLLHLNYPDCDPVNVLYKYFEGVYTGDIEELKKGNAFYNAEYEGCHSLPKKELALLSNVKSKKKFKLKKQQQETFQAKIRIKNEAYAESQKQVCIKDSNGKIIRIQRYFVGPFIKKGWSFASKKEYKEQQDTIAKKRKEMAEGNIEEQLLHYKGNRNQRRGNVKGQPGSPYMRNQLIVKETLDKKNPEFIAQETIKVKRLVPHYEYIPIVWNVYEYHETTYQKEVWDKRTGVCQIRTITERVKGKLIETVPFLNDKGEPIKRKKFVENVEEWVTIIRDVPTIRKTIKVLQIPSKKMMHLKYALNEDKERKNEGAPVITRVRSQRNKYLLSEDKTGKQRWEAIYAPNKVD
jgi:hypothetical protein